MENCLGELCLSASFRCNYTANLGKPKILGFFNLGGSISLQEVFDIRIDEREGIFWS
jgi:hypothetical protein